MRQEMIGVETEWRLYLESKMDCLRTAKYGVIKTLAAGGLDGIKAFYKQCEDQGVGIAGAAISFDGTTFFFQSESDLTAARIML